MANTGHIPGTCMLKTLYLKPLQDLSEVLGADYAGIHSPTYSPEELDRYLARQFTTDHADYVREHEHSDFTGKVLQRSFERIDLPAETPAEYTILDLGSGSGNSIFPLLETFPQHRIIASDLSPHMLLALKQALVERQQLHRCELLQLNAEQLDFREQSVDLVVGIALLHHLIRPDLALAGVARVLKPGGVAIFSEPFENGNYPLRMAYEQMLSHPQTHDIPDTVRHCLTQRIAFIDSRKGLTRTEAELAGLDDKWLFTRALFAEQARQHGFRDVDIMPLAQQADYLQRRTRAMLKRHHHAADSLPDWCWHILHRFETGMSQLLRQEMPVEAAVIFRK